ncbi:MAG: flagellar hook-basal body complex protein FliE [Candidatus Margulisbacteria bacterium]|jgi:flagellar hook-basal body complex protein FliE|nr:flagellar hook-basal body complex protein FliE [Candidatus Margulisiibacteriota bacterium]
MVQGIDPVSANQRLAQILGDEPLMAQAESPVQMGQGAGGVTRAGFTGNAFDDLLGKAIESLDGVSKTEFHANQVIDQYIKGKADLQEVMVAQSKATIMAQLAVTTVNAAVNTFKEITQMQI